MDAPTSEWDFDLLVLGGGMAGLSAAVDTAREGGTVLLVERAPALGGSMAYAGFLHTAHDLAELQRVDPAADLQMQARLVEGYPSGVAFIESLGVECLPEVPVVRFTRGRHFDTGAFITAAASAIRTAPGSGILLGGRTEQLLQSDGRVNGAALVAADGSRTTVRAASTLLATGGFQGDPDLLAEHLHLQGPLMPLRSNVTSRGDGLRLGVAAGGTVGPRGAGFYGHLVPFGVPLTDPSQFVPLAQFYSEHGLLFNTEGERFVDETVSDAVSTMAVLEQPGARALLVLDQRVRDHWRTTPLVAGTSPGPERFDLAARRGARCAVAHDLAEFDDLPPEWGYPGEAIGSAVAQANQACAGGEPASPPRAYDAKPLVDPPYYVIDVCPAITFTFAGLRVDADTHVLDADHRPVPGLLAAGADAGGTFVRQYAGGIANALVFGLTAARSARHDLAVAAIPPKES